MSHRGFGERYAVLLYTVYRKTLTRCIIEYFYRRRCEWKSFPRLTFTFTLIVHFVFPAVCVLEFLWSFFFGVTKCKWAVSGACLAHHEWSTFIQNASMKKKKSVSMCVQFQISLEGCHWFCSFLYQAKRVAFTKSNDCNSRQNPKSKAKHTDASLVLTDSPDSMCTLVFH